MLQLIRKGELKINEDFPPLIFHSDTLGEIVRNAWIEWARRQPEPKESWLVPYGELCQADKDADIEIGLAVVAVCNRRITEMINS